MLVTTSARLTRECRLLLDSRDTLQAACGTSRVSSTDSLGLSKLACLWLLLMPGSPPATSVACQGSVVLPVVVSRVQPTLVLQVTSYAIESAQQRGRLFCASGDEVYEGQVVGIHQRAGDLRVNVCKRKAANNIRRCAASHTPCQRNLLSRSG